MDLPEDGLGLSKQPDTMLAVMAGHRGEFVKATAPGLSGKRLVLVPCCCQQLLFRRFAFASRKVIAS